MQNVYNRAFWKLLIPNHIPSVAKIMNFQYDFMRQFSMENKNLTVHYFIVCIAREMKGITQILMN